MKAGLVRFWHAAVASFWFVPAIMIAVVIPLSFLIIHIDRSVDYRGGWVFAGDPEAARQVLATVAGSMATVAGVAFSITMVALTVASSSFGPRLLRNFMRDKGNQAVLGMFIATFIYSMLVLRQVRGEIGEIAQFVPHVSITVAIFFSIVALILFIWFIHHVSSSIEADNIVRVVRLDIDKALNEGYPHNFHTMAAEEDFRLGDKDVPEDMEAHSREIVAMSHGYIESIDIETLFEIADEKDIVVRLIYRVGEFVLEDSTVAYAWPAQRIDDKTAKRLSGLVITEENRTIVQDVEFAVDQLVEVAVRALSPGVNDTFTAIACVDRLGSGLVSFIEKARPWPYHAGCTGKLRLIAKPVTFDGITDAAFNMIRQSAANNVAVSIRMLETFADVMDCSHTKEQRDALMRHAAMVRDAILGNVREKYDIAEVNDRHEYVLKVMREKEAEGK